MCGEHASQVVTRSNWTVAATSVRGSSHEKLDTVCQDAHAWTVRDDGILIAAVADGAGSAKHSDVGAAVASQKAVEILCDAAEMQIEGDFEAFRSVLNQALEGALLAVTAEAELMNVAVRELASTLIVVIAGSQRVVAAQIGDGAVVLCDDADALIALTTPDSGEYINQTTFLILPGAVNRAQIHCYEGNVAQLAIFSDGLQMLALAMPFGKPHAPFFTPLFRFVKQAEDQSKTEDQLASFLGSDRVRARTDDDVTLMLATLMDCAHGTGC